jgi:hypothetical protein
LKLKTGSIWSHTMLINCLPNTWHHISRHFNIHITTNLASLNQVPHAVLWWQSHHSWKWTLQNEKSTNTGYKFAWVTKFYSVVPNIYGSSIWSSHLKFWSGTYILGRFVNPCFKISSCLFPLGKPMWSNLVGTFNRWQESAEYLKTGITACIKSNTSLL